MTEEQAFAKWQEIGPLVDALARRSDTEGEWTVSPGSSLSGDDAASSPYQVSHAIHQCMVAGIDHVHALKSLVLDHQEIHIAAPGSLARGFVENMATAFWLLHPGLRRERVTHAMQWYVRNAKDQHEALQGLEHLPPPRRSQRDRVAQMIEIAQRAGAEDAGWLQRGYRPTEPVRYADQHARPGGDGVLFAWQLCSGFAHGRPWAFLGVLEREDIATDDPDVLHVRMTNDFARSLLPVLIGMHLTEVVLRLHQQRAKALYP